MHRLGIVYWNAIMTAMVKLNFQIGVYLVNGHRICNCIGHEARPYFFITRIQFKWVQKQLCKRSTLNIKQLYWYQIYNYWFYCFISTWQTDESPKRDKLPFLSHSILLKSLLQVMLYLLVGLSQVSFNIMIYGVQLHMYTILCLLMFAI